MNKYTFHIHPEEFEEVLFQLCMGKILTRRVFCDIVSRMSTCPQDLAVSAIINWLRDNRDPNNRAIGERRSGWYRGMIVNTMKIRETP